MNANSSRGAQYHLDMTRLQVRPREDTAKATVSSLGDRTISRVNGSKDTRRACTRHRRQLPRASRLACGHTWALAAHHGRQKYDPHAAQVPAEGAASVTAGCSTSTPLPLWPCLWIRSSYSRLISTVYSSPDSAREHPTLPLSSLFHPRFCVIRQYVHACAPQHSSEDVIGRSSAFT